MLVVDRTADNVEQFAGDGLLSALVVLKVQLTQQFVGIVCCRLHSHHTGGMFRRNTIEQSRVKRQMS